MNTETQTTLQNKHDLEKMDLVTRNGEFALTCTRSNYKEFRDKYLYAQVSNLIITTNINGTNYFLITKRSGTKDVCPLEWEFPGGMVDAGETPFVAASRELFEETGFQIQPQDLISAGTIIDDQKQYIRHTFIAKIPAHNNQIKPPTPPGIPNDEIIKYEWISEDEIKNLKVFTDRKFVNHTIYIHSYIIAYLSTLK